MNPQRHQYLKNGCLFLIFCFLFHITVPAVVHAAGGPALSNIKLANTRDDLLVYFEVENAFPQRVAQAIENGIPRTFSFYISLYKTGDSWRDRKIAHIEIKSTIKFNSL
ncbi:MAG: DUF4390 domain-containing protein, partial [Desulfotignum sp.]